MLHFEFKLSLKIRLLVSTLILATTNLIASACLAGESNAPPEGPLDRALRRGYEAYQGEDLETAREAFTEAWTIEQHGGVAGTLADIETRLGNYVKAVEYWRFYLRNLPPEREDSRAKAQERLNEVLAYVGQLNLEISPARAKVSLNGSPVSRAAHGETVPVEPGAHVLKAEFQGYLPVTQEIGISAGKTKTISVHLKEVAAPPAPLEPPPMEDNAAGMSARTVVVLTGAGLTLVAATVSGIAWLDYKNHDDERERLLRETRNSVPDDAPDRNILCSTRGHENCDDIAREAEEQDSAGRLANAALWATGAFGLGTLAAWLFWPEPSENEQMAATGLDVRLTPLASPSFSGIQASGRF